MTISMNGAVMTLARYEARQIIKRELYGQGIKLSHVEASEITRKANQYVEDHPEIIALQLAGPSATPLRPAGARAALQRNPPSRTTKNKKALPALNSRARV